MEWLISSEVIRVSLTTFILVVAVVMAAIAFPSKLTIETAYAPTHSHRQRSFSDRQLEVMVIASLTRNKVIDPSELALIDDKEEELSIV
jgi:hypothetical protein